MATTYQKLTIAAVTEVECCNGRTLEDGHLAVGTLYCPKCNAEAWMSQGYTVEHNAGACFFLPARKAASHLMRFPWVGVTSPTEEEAGAILFEAAA